MKHILPCAMLALTLLLLAPSAWAADQVVTNLTDNGAGSLRAAISSVGAGETITFQPGLTGTITLTTGELAISRSMTITGPGPEQLTITGNNVSRVFHVTSDSTVTLSGVTITGGKSGATASGGGVYNDHGCTLTLTDCVITANTADQHGGGIYNGGALTMESCVVTDNSADYGAGITNYMGL